MLLPNVRQSFKFYANVCLGGLALLSASVHAAPENDAGEVTFLLGKAYINGSTPVAVGSKIGSGDVIQTLGNGHVHIRFVDNGLVSVRPESRLAIEHYEYNTAHPNESVIKFSLDEGVMRSISGEGAKAARDKFRLNTPIAAIGVRGTDFVVKSSNDLLQAVVNEGAIIVAPYSNDCQAASVGPCHSNFVELDSDAQQLLEFSSLYSAPRLLPLSAGVPSVEIDSSKIQSRPARKSSTDSDESNQDD
ncbi:MAG: FecR domain-containing protein, partial [Marinomonas atlantica]|nr:FecR domain-containing protein [Marinomonas atlantica]